MSLEESDDLKEFCTNIHLIILPSTLWSIHIDPQYRYIAVVHIQVESFCKLVINKGILLTKSKNEKLIKTSFFIQNNLINIPKLNDCIMTIADLSQVIQIMHELKICPNFAQPECNKYVDFNKYDNFCDFCTEEPPDHVDVVKGGEEAEADVLELNERMEIQNDFICEICKEVFKKRTLLIDHLSAHTKENSFICEICNKVSNRQSSHEKHIQTHSTEKSCLCSVCGKTFCQEYHMKQHFLTHSVERPFECHICKKVFAKSYNLKIHQKIHSGDRPYVCSMCGKTYTTQSNLMTHVRSVHTKEKPHACSKCDMSFVHPRQLRLHMFKHTGEKPYSCMICGKCFAKKIHLTIHFRTHTGETIDCFKCVSLNNDYKPCEDPFHNNFTLDIYESPCMGGKKGRDGLFPATSCIKIAGTFDDNGDTIVVRGCALDSGTLTTDTEIVRLSHCGGFHYDNRYVRGCVQSCNDADACNNAPISVPFNLIIYSILFKHLLIQIA
ncbi:hypothetical protein FQR65_LT04947 [Abscondita terminalis]|nr:hypothetical protein FQR65_LT04947 [Abscondita terminalis]